MTTLRASAGREVRRQLGSPVSWLVVGVFALLAGGAFVTSLNTFLDASLEALSAPPARPVNVNQLLIRPFLVQVGIAALLVLPLVTARAYSTRTRATAPQSTPAATLPSVLAPFIGVLAVYGVMLVTSLGLVVALFLYSAPEWAPIASGYLGLLLVGGAFISAALFISSLATSVMPAAVATFAVSFALAAFTWLARSAAPGARPVFRQFAVGQALDDFARGVIDTGHIVTCLTIVSLALFLTRHTRPPDEQAR